jgi:hypothetical protein
VGNDKALLWMAVILLQVFFLGGARADVGDTRVRLAIVPETADASSVADLLMAQFSRNAQIILLEREAIQKVVHEQAVSAANNNYLNLGRILGADGLLMLESTKKGTNIILRFRLIAVGPGALLTAGRSSLPSGKPGEWAAELSTQLTPLLPKLKVAGKEAVAISILNLRSAVASEDSRELERELTILTIERLSREQKIFVLERRNPQLLTEENEFKGGDDSSFSLGSYLLEGTIDPEGVSKEKMTIRARLVPPGKGVPVLIEVNCRRGDLAEAVNQLAVKTMAGLKLAGAAAPWNAADEADRFFAEAKWAHRWHLYPQAQAASESAWALGKRSRDLAELRVRAYSEVFHIDDVIGNLVVPAVPDQAGIGPTARSLEVFRAESRLLFTNGSTIDESWFATGLRAVRPAALLLDAFYHAAELREGNEEKLMELRSLTKEVVEFMTTRMNPGWSSSALPGSIVSRNEWYDTDGKSIRQKVEKLFEVVWNEGGLWHENPNESLAMFRGLIESGYVPKNLPRVVGWTWEGRKQASLAKSRFVREFSIATNQPARLGGLLLDVIQTPYYPQEVFRNREAALLRGIWENRQYILSDFHGSAFLLQAVEILFEKTGYYPSHRLEDVAVLMHRLRKDYLLKSAYAHTAEWQEALWTAGLDVISAEEARELEPLFENFQKTNSWIGRIAALYRRKAGVTPSVSSAEANRASIPASKVMAVPLTAWKLAPAQPGQITQPEVVRIIVRGTLVVAHVIHHSDQGLLPFVYPSSYVIINLRSGDCTEIPFPEKIGYPDAGFEVAADGLFVSVQSHIFYYAFQEKKWTSFPIPTDQGGQIFEVAEHLFLATSDSLMEVDRGSKEVRIIASSRRQPTLSEMDSRLESGQQQYFRVQGSLVLSLGSRRELFTYAPATGVWKTLPGLPSSVLPNILPINSQNGMYLLLRGEYTRSRLVAVCCENEKPELLLEKGGSSQPREPGFKTLGSPRWSWPEPYRVDQSPIAGLSNCVWFLTPRKIPTGFGPREEPIDFHDDRHATLIWFIPGMKQAMTVPIRFEQDGHLIDPFDPVVARPSFNADPMPFLIATPLGLVVACPGVAGHWFIAKSSSEERGQKLDVTITETQTELRAVGPENPGNN